MYLKNQYLSTTTRYKAGRQTAHPPTLLHSSSYHLPDTTSTRQAAKSALLLWIFIPSQCGGRLALSSILNTGVRVGLIPNLIFPSRRQRLNCKQVNLICLRETTCPVFVFLPSVLRGVMVILLHVNVV